MKWAYKKQNNFTIYNVALKKKKKEKHLQISLSKSWWYDLKFLRYRAKQTKIANFRLFFTLSSPWKSQKSKILKNEKNCWRYHFTQVYQKSQSYDVWLLRYGLRWKTFFVILGHFLHFYHPTLPNDPKNQNFERKKMKKMPKILLFYRYMCTINLIIYGAWNIRCDRQKFVILGHFLPFQALTTPKIKILKMKITPGDIIILHIWTINDNHMKCGSWDVKHNIHNFLPFWTVFCPFTPTMDPKNQNFEKWKKYLKILSFYKCVP